MSLYAWSKCGCSYIGCSFSLDSKRECDLSSRSIILKSPVCITCMLSWKIQVQNPNENYHYAWKMAKIITMLTIRIRSPQTSTHCSFSGFRAAKIYTAHQVLAGLCSPQKQERQPEQHLLWMLVSYVQWAPTHSWSRARDCTYSSCVAVENSLLFMWGQIHTVGAGQVL